LAAVEQVGSAGAPAGRALAVLALLGVVLALMIAPALIAGASLLDSHLLDRTSSWFHWIGALTPYLDLGRLGTTLALAGIVSRAKEDQ
jgi:hypothetical protein